MVTNWKPEGGANRRTLEKKSGRTQILWRVQMINPEEVYVDKYCITTIRLPMESWTFCSAFQIQMKCLAKDLFHTMNKVQETYILTIFIGTYGSIIILKNSLQD